MLSFAPILLVGCADAASPVVPARQMSAPDLTSRAQAAEVPRTRLVDAIQALRGRPGPQAALTRGRLIRALAWRDGDTALLAEARAALDEAATAEGGLGCQARLERLRLEANDAWDASAALRAARELLERYGEVPEVAGCAASARRAVETLAPLAPVDAAAARLESVEVLGAAEDARGVRIVVRTSAPVPYRREPLPGGQRGLALRFDALLVPPTQVRSQRVDSGGLGELSVAGGAGGGHVALTFSAEGEASVFALSEPPRIVIDVARRSNTPRGEGAPRLIVLDPGHGGNDWGARYDGMEEADLVLDIAARASGALGTLLPRARVVLTRTRDRFVDLPSRTAMANALDADLFVSIHLNSANEEVTHGGVTTFVLDTGNERQALRLAARENGTDTADVGELSRVLAHLYRREQVAASRALAAEVQRETLGAARRTLPRLPDRGVQQAMFHVLVGARMPAILVEASFLTEPREAAALRRPSYRQALAEGIARGVARYVGAH